MRISKGGQVSIPAGIRHRWGTSTVVLEDLGDRIVLAPAPDDPIAAAEGALAEARLEVALGQGANGACVRRPSPHALDLSSELALAPPDGARRRTRASQSP